MGSLRISVPESRVVPKAKRRSFSEVKAGEICKVVGVNSEEPDCVRLQEMGLSVGAEFRVVEVAPFGDPVQICLRGYRLCLRRREATAFEVETVEQECPCSQLR